VKKVNITLDLVVLGLTIFFFYESLSLPEGKGSPGTNPAIYQQIILISIIIFILIDLATIFVKENKEKFLNQVERKHFNKFILVISTLIVFILLFKNVPFIVLAVGVIFIQCLILKLKPVMSIIIAVALGVSVYSLFVYGLNIIL